MFSFLKLDIEGYSNILFIYRLYSRARYDNLALNATAEILRTPLLELCLQAKLLACNDTSIRYVLNLK